MLRTKDAAKIGTTTFRLWVRSWDADHEDWRDDHHSEHRTYDDAFNQLVNVTGEAADITKIRWDEDILTDRELGGVLDAEGVETERWYFYYGDKDWVLDEHAKLA